MANSVVNMVMSGLGTAQASVSNAGSYDIIGSLTLPGISKGDPSNSQVVTVVKQNGTTMYTGLPGAEGFQLILQCAAADIIAVQLSSAAAVDQGINVIKAVVSIG